MVVTGNWLLKIKKPLVVLLLLDLNPSRKVIRFILWLDELYLFSMSELGI
jgi:hypothetical protein